MTLLLWTRGVMACLTIGALLDARGRFTNNADKK